MRRLSPPTSHISPLDHYLYSTFHKISSHSLIGFLFSQHIQNFPFQKPYILLEVYQISQASDTDFTFDMRTYSPFMLTSVPFATISPNFYKSLTFRFTIYSNQKSFASRTPRIFTKRVLSKMPMMMMHLIYIYCDDTM